MLIKESCGLVGLKFMIDSRAGELVLIVDCQ